MQNLDNLIQNLFQINENKLASYTEQFYEHLNIKFGQNDTNHENTLHFWTIQFIHAIKT